MIFIMVWKNSRICNCCNHFTWKTDLFFRQLSDLFGHKTLKKRKKAEKLDQSKDLDFVLNIIRLITDDPQLQPKTQKNRNTLFKSLTQLIIVCTITCSLFIWSSFTVHKLSYSFPFTVFVWWCECSFRTVDHYIY